MQLRVDRFEQAIDECGDEFVFLRIVVLRECPRAAALPGDVRVAGFLVALFAECERIAMPKAKNQELVQAVECAVGRSFLSNATSYQVIADAAGTTRANVQYVADKKENLLMRFMERALGVTPLRKAPYRKTSASMRQVCALFLRFSMVLPVC